MDKLLSRQILDWHYMGNEIPAKEWSEIAAKLEMKITELSDEAFNYAQQLADIEAENEKPITRFRIFAITHSDKNATQMADEIIAALKDAGIEVE